jgi:polysaccharide biosynthesis/export protein
MGLALFTNLAISQIKSVFNPAKPGPIIATQKTESFSPATSNPLQPFGYNLFRSQILPSNETTPGGYLSPNYKLGPGDRLGIYLGGKAQEQFEAFVSLDGKVYIPTVGVFEVTGLSLQDFKSTLDAKLKSLYSDYDVNVLLLVPKTVWVNVLGEVNAPGQYPVSSLFSVLDALALAQGVTNIGSLRDVQIYRKSNLVAHIDLYNFILSPNNSTTFYLQSGDKIFVPVLQSRVEVHGQVNRPAIYELSPTTKESVSEIIQLAGGFTEKAYKNKMELSRLADGTRSVQYLDLSDNSAQTDASVTILNYDQVTVFSILDQVPLAKVTIHGEVKKPGVFSFQENMRVSDLILKAGSLTRSAYKLLAEIAQVEPDGTVNTVKLDLDSILSGADNDVDILLGPDDHLFIRRIPDWELDPIIEVRGEVVFPGHYAVKKDTTRLSEILKKAGGFTDEALVAEAKLVRTRDTELLDKEFERLRLMDRGDMSDLEYEYFVMQQNLSDADEIVIDLLKLMNSGDANEDVFLRPGDVIYIPAKPHVVYVSGRVSKSGGIVYAPGAGMDYYVDKAGGFTWDANPRKTRIIKVNGEIKDDEDVKSFQPGDRIWVPRKSDLHFWQILRDVVLMAGQVATIYLVIDNATGN